MIMSLIKCPECQHGISDTAKNCLNCGYKIKMAWAEPLPFIRLFKINHFKLAYDIMSLAAMGACGHRHKAKTT